MPELGTVIAFAVCTALFLAALGGGWFFLQRRIQSERERADDLQRQLELVRQSISGLTAGAVGMDRRMQQLEAREKVLSERQETYEIQQLDDQPYSHAIRLVPQGAGVTRLVEELELSESEADLIVRLHGHRESA